MTKMATIPIYGKKTLDFFFLQKQLTNGLETWYIELGT